jgi:hypothetical protein
MRDVLKGMERYTTSTHRGNNTSYVEILAVGKPADDEDDGIHTVVVPFPGRRRKR